jgi:hypothetical protein
MNTKNNSRETINLGTRLTYDELVELQNLFSDIRMARDDLASKGFDIGSYQLNSVTDAERMLLPLEEECIDWEEITNF